MWVAVAAVGGAVVAGVASNMAAGTQADAISGAAATSADASNYAANLQKQMYDQTRTDQTPWRDAGANALAQMSAGIAPGGSLVKPFGISDYTADPGYAFRLSEGVKALDRSASSRGQLLSGSALKGITRFGQDNASQEYQNAYNRYQSNQTNQFNRLASVAGVGQTANNALQTAGAGYANSAGNIAMQNGANQANAGIARGQVNASMYQGIGNAIGGAMNNLGGSGGGYSPNMYNTWNALGGNAGPSGSWVNPDTGSTWQYS